MNLNPEQKTVTIKALAQSLTESDYRNGALRYEIDRIKIELEDTKTIHAQAIALERKAVSCLLEDNSNLREEVLCFEKANRILLITCEGILKDFKQMEDDNKNLKCFIGLMQASNNI